MTASATKSKWRSIVVLSEGLTVKLVAEFGRPSHEAVVGNHVAGTYRQRFTLASGSP